MEAISKSELKNSIDFWDETIEAFNELLKENWRKNQAIIYQDDVTALIISKRLNKYNQPANEIRMEISDTHQLDIEELYISKGFIVEYDKPAYCETYRAYFKFT